MSSKSNRPSDSERELLLDSFNKLGKWIKVLVFALVFVGVYIGLIYASEIAYESENTIQEILKKSMILVVYFIIGIVMILLRKFSMYKMKFLRNIDDFNTKRYFFNIQMRKPIGDNPVEKFLSLAKEIDPDNDNFSKNDSFIDDSKEITKSINNLKQNNVTIDACIKIKNDIPDFDSIPNNWYYRFHIPKQLAGNILERYFIVKYFEEPIDRKTFDDFIEKFGDSFMLNKPLNKLYIFRLVIISPQFNFEDLTVNLPEKLTWSDTWMPVIDLITEQKINEDTRYRFFWSKTQNDEEIINGN